MEKYRGSEYSFLIIDDHLSTDISTVASSPTWAVPKYEQQPNRKERRL